MRILGVGIATLDLIAEVPAFPAEDAEIRALSLGRRRGGNVTNSLVVLSQLGHRCAWAGALADDPERDAILADLRRHAIDTGPARLFPGSKTPTSLVWSSVATGSRTIVHYRDLPEYPAEAFASLDLAAFDWVHFEGRAVEQLAAMLRRPRREGGPPCSLEIEKPRPGIEALFGLADALLFSRHYAERRGFASAPELLRAVAAEHPATPLFCAWGAQGGHALVSGQPLHSPACPPPRLVDSLGAGDVFNGGIIHGLVNRWPARQALELACRLAGVKCGQRGFEGLADA